MKNVILKKLSLRQINEIKPLWESLNQVHLADTVFFKDHYKSFTFEKRSARWRIMTDEDILILVAESEEKKLIGYCISTQDQLKQGEIDSLYVTPEFRGKGVGKILTERSLEWLQSNRCNPIRLAISYGHESVISFYQKIGFYPRMTILEYKNKL
jgi:diamine N-acetyltransferase